MDCSQPMEFGCLKGKQLHVACHTKPSTSYCFQGFVGPASACCRCPQTPTDPENLYLCVVGELFEHEHNHLCTLASSAVTTTPFSQHKRLFIGQNDELSPEAHDSPSISTNHLRNKKHQIVLCHLRVNEDEFAIAICFDCYSSSARFGAASEAAHVVCHLLKCPLKIAGLGTNRSVRHDPEARNARIRSSGSCINRQCISRTLQIASTVLHKLWPVRGAKPQLQGRYVVVKRRPAATFLSV